MTGTDLADKLKRTPSYVDDLVTATGVVPAEVQAACAKNAFLLNLLGHLEIDPDEEPDPRATPLDGAVALLERLLGILRKRRKAVPERLIKKAHCDMVLPMTRSIISSLLYGEGTAVTWLGVPKSYGAA